MCTAGSRFLSPQAKLFMSWGCLCRTSRHCALGLPCALMPAALSDLYGTAALSTPFRSSAPPLPRTASFSLHGDQNPYFNKHRHPIWPVHWIPIICIKIILDNCIKRANTHFISERVCMYASVSMCSCMCACTCVILQGNSRKLPPLLGSGVILAADRVYQAVLHGLNPPVVRLQDTTRLHFMSDITPFI